MREPTLPRGVIVAFAGVLLFVLSTRSIGAEIPWPAEDLASAINLTPVEGPGVNDFHTNLSGAFWNPDTRRLWLCRNGGLEGSKFWVLRENGQNGFVVDTRNSLRGEWTNFGDLEAITQANYNEDTVYLLIEGEERIKEFNVSVYGTAVLRNNWNLLPFLPVVGSSGAEGIAFVPDSFLVAQNFVDGNGNPYVSRHGMGGVMLVAHQNGGRVYAFDLNRVTGAFSFVGAYKTNFTESCELTFDRSDGRLYVLHNADWNRLEVTTLGSTFVSPERKLNEIVTYGRPTGSPANWNLEGFALMSNGDCANGTRSAFVTIDDGGANSLYWYRSFPCTCASGDIDGDGVNNCDDQCPGTPQGQPVDPAGCACGQGSLTWPLITVQPTGGAVCPPGAQALCVVATGSGPLTYQWKLNGANVVGATSSCYSATNPGTYQCTVSNSCGSVVSNVVLVSQLSPPSIVTQPRSATICSGQVAYLCVTAMGSGPLAYQWQVNNSNIVGAVASCFVATSAGTYRCVITNPCGSISSAAVVVTVTSGSMWYADLDGDGYGNALISTHTCVQPAGFVLNNQDCNDADARVNPGAMDVCSEDRNCDAAFPSPPTWYVDVDQDGYGDPGVSTVSCVQPAGFVANQLDCNDRSPLINQVSGGCGGVQPGSASSDGD